MRHALDWFDWREAKVRDLLLAHVILQVTPRNQVKWVYCNLTLNLIFTTVLGAIVSLFRVFFYQADGLPRRLGRGFVVVVIVMAALRSGGRWFYSLDFGLWQLVSSALVIA